MKKLKVTLVNMSERAMFDEVTRKRWTQFEVINFTKGNFTFGEPYMLKMIKVNVDNEKSTWALYQKPIKGVRGSKKLDTVVLSQEDLKYLHSSLGSRNREEADLILGELLAMHNLDKYLLD